MTYLVGLIGGLSSGAVFGVAFGAFASVFRNGPPAQVGIAESWWWFALVGAGIGLGVARAVVTDRQRARRRMAP